MDSVIWVIEQHFLYIFLIKKFRYMIRPGFHSLDKLVFIILWFQHKPYDEFTNVKK